jgi:phosphoglycolate phosphatase-like HAD superfamily hydrolase
VNSLIIIDLSASLSRRQLMNLKSFYKYVDKYVEGAFPKRGTTALEALAWIVDKGSTWKLAIFSSNPTEKTKAYLTVRRYFEARVGDRRIEELEPSDVLLDIRKQASESIFFSALGSIKICRAARTNPKPYIKEAKKALAELKKLRVGAIPTLERFLEEAVRS